MFDFSMKEYILKGLGQCLANQTELPKSGHAQPKHLAWMTLNQAGRSDSNQFQVDWNGVSLLLETLIC